MRRSGAGALDSGEREMVLDLQKLSVEVLFYLGWKGQEVCIKREGAVFGDGI